MDMEQLTGDDDSVEHAWNTVAVEVRPGVVENIDKGIAPLVLALLRIPGVETFASCEGHPHSRVDARAYVMFAWRGLQLDVRLPPDQIELATSVLSTLASQ